MTTKQVKAKVSVSTSATRADDLVKAIKQGQTISESINAICKAEKLSRKGKDVGTVKSGDVFMVELRKGLIASGYKEGSTLNNIMTSVRNACNKGTAFSMNATREAKKKGSQAGKTVKNGKATKQGITVKIDGTPSEEDVAKALRGIFNKFKANEQYANLMGFLIDGLDEFDGE